MVYNAKNNISVKVVINLLVLLGSFLIVKLWGFQHSAAKLIFRYSYNDAASLVSACGANTIPGCVSVALILLSDG